MPEYKMIEVKPEEVGLREADMLVALVNALLKKGIKQELAEKIAISAASALSCKNGHCSGTARWGSLE